MPTPYFPPPAAAMPPSVTAHRPSPWQPEVLAQMRARHAGKRVLIADHSPTDRQRLFALLADAGLDLDFAIDGADAVTRASDRPAELILMHLQMPVMDGLTASRILRALPFGRQVPIIAMSSGTIDDECAACFAAGIDDILAKPFAADAVHRCLLRWLDRSAAAALAGRRHAPLSA